MNPFTAPWVSALGWALVDFLWQGALVGLGVALALRLLRGARPSSRYATTCAGLVLCLALPVAGFLRRLPAPSEPPPPVAMADPSSPPALIHAEPIANGAPALDQGIEDHLPLIVLVWATGAALVSLRLAWGLAWVRSLRRNATAEVPEAWQRALDRLSGAFELGRAIRLRVVSHLESPVTAGVWRPVIFLPVHLLTGMSPELVEALLAHELAHIQRHDYLVNLLQSILEGLLFYHPAVWWISHRIRIEREHLCDDLAAKALGEPRRLALALQELDRFQFATVHLAQGAHGGHLMTRIRRLIHPEPRPLPWKALASILGLTVACAACATLAAAHLQAPPRIPPVPPAPPAPPRPPKPPKPPFPAHPASDLTYLFARADGSISSSGPCQGLERLRDAKGGAFFAFRHQGQSYRLDDPAELARVQELFKPLDEMGRRMGELGQEMGVQSEKFNAVQAEWNAGFAKEQPHSDRLTALGQEMGSLGSQLSTLTQRQHSLEAKLERKHLPEAEKARLEKELKDLESRMDQVEARMDELGNQMDAESQNLEKAHQRLESMEQTMEEAGKPMEAVGQRMEALGRDMEREGEKLESALKELMVASVASGRAKPVLK